LYMATTFKSFALNFGLFLRLCQEEKKGYQQLLWLH